MYLLIILYLFKNEMTQSISYSDFSEVVVEDSYLVSRLSLVESASLLVFSTLGNGATPNSSKYKSF